MAPLFEQKQNTEGLQERFPEVYQKFFAENDLVVSSDITYALTLSGLSWRIGSPLVGQKLPCKVYVGVQSTSGVRSLERGSARVYYSSEKKFLDSDYELLDWKRALPYLEHAYLEKLSSNKKSGLILNFLLEKPEHLSFDCSLSMMITNALSLYFNIITPEEIGQMTALGMDEINSRNSDLAKKFHFLHAQAIRFMAVAITPATSGSTIYFNFFQSEYPLIHFTEERGGTVGRRYAGLFPENVAGHEKLLEDMRWWGFRLNEMSRISGSFPLDVASVSLASSNEELPFYEYVDHTVLPQFDALQDFVAQSFRSVRASPPHRLPLFLKHLKVAGRFWHEYAAGITYSGLFFIQKLINLYTHTLSSQAIEEFLEAFNASLYQDIPPMRSPSKNIRHALRLIEQKGDAVGIPVGRRVIAEDKQDANVLIFAPMHKFRNEIKEIVSQIQRELNPKAHIDFASWRDGWGGDGLRVEQFISKGMYSKFIGSDAVQRVQWKRGGGVRASISTRTSFEGAGCDLLIDMLSEKIRVAGKECTSRELPSQKATVAIMDALLTAEGHRLHNRALPESGYARYRNEFQGKITGPLAALIKKRLKKRLPFKVEGALTDFWVSLDPKGFAIGVIKKLAAHDTDKQ